MRFVIVAAIACGLAACGLAACGSVPPLVGPWARSNEEAAAWRAANKKCREKADRVRMTDRSSETERRAVLAYESCMKGEGWHRIE